MYFPCLKVQLWLFFMQNKMWILHSNHDWVLKFAKDNWKFVKIRKKTVLQSGADHAIATRPCRLSNRELNKPPVLIMTTNQSFADLSRGKKKLCFGCCLYRLWWKENLQSDSHNHCWKRVSWQDSDYANVSFWLPCIISLSFLFFLSLSLSCTATHSSCTRLLASVFFLYMIFWPHYNRLLAVQSPWVTPSQKMSSIFSLSVRTSA